MPQVTTHRMLASRVPMTNVTISAHESTFAQGLGKDFYKSMIGKCLHAVTGELLSKKSRMKKLNKTYGTYYFIYF